MLDFYISAKEMYKNILNYCRNQGWITMSNEERNLVSLHFHLMDMTEEVSIKVHEDKKVIAINTILPVYCRSENVDRLKMCLQEINSQETSSYGCFQMDGRRVVYVYAFTYEGESRFNDKAFAVYMDTCIMIPYLNADRIMDIATEHVSPPVFNPDWADLEREIFRDPIVTDPDDTLEFDSLKEEDYTDDLASWRENLLKHKIPPEDW